MLFAFLIKNMSCGTKRRPLLCLACSSCTKQGQDCSQHPLCPTAVLWHNLSNKIIRGSRVQKNRVKCGQFVGLRLDPVELWIQVWCCVAVTPGLCGTEEGHWMRGKRGGMPQMVLCTPVPHLAFSGAPPPWSGSQLWPTIKGLTVADVTLADGCFFVV